MGQQLPDLTGQKFFKWTVIRFSRYAASKEPKWICRCECGNEYEVFHKFLLQGGSQSCVDCARKARIKDLTGRKLGHLTVLKMYGRENGKRQAITWQCLCDCGETAVIRGSSLVSGDYVTCGCGRGKQAIPKRLHF
jgi:hypothetical protein